MLVAGCGSCSAADAATQVHEVKGFVDIKITLILCLRKAARVGCQQLFFIYLRYQVSKQTLP